jgi:hypothetical protein
VYVGVIICLNETKIIQNSNRLTEKYYFNVIEFIFVLKDNNINQLKILFKINVYSGE